MIIPVPKFYRHKCFNPLYLTPFLIVQKRDQVQINVVVTLHLTKRKHLITVQVITLFPNNCFLIASDVERVCKSF